MPIGAPLQYQGHHYVFACALEQAYVPSTQAAAILFSEERNDHVYSTLGEILPLFGESSAPSPPPSQALGKFLRTFVDEC